MVNASHAALPKHDLSSPAPHELNSGGRPASWRETFLLRVASGQFAGITTGDWLTLLRDNRYAVDRPYLLRAALVTLVSLGNSMLRRCENAVYGPSVREDRGPIAAFYPGPLAIRHHAPAQSIGRRSPARLSESIIKSYFRTRFSVRSRSAPGCWHCLCRSIAWATTWPSTSACPPKMSLPSA